MVGGLAEISGFTRKPSELLASTMDENALESLTARERDALLLMAQGYRVGEIGPRMSVSTSTVESHLKSARRKLGFSSSLLAARAVYGENAHPRNLGSGLSGMVSEASDGDREEPVRNTEPAREQTATAPDLGRTDRSSDVLGRVFGRHGNRNGLTKTERLVAWLLLTAVVGIGAFASLAIPYLVDALHRR